MNNIEMLADTLNIVEKGGYEYDGCFVPLKLDGERLISCRVFLPEAVHSIVAAATIAPDTRCAFSCENTDSFVLARRIASEHQSDIGEGRVLVLNLANPFRPGGGVRNGARAQEEDLCRKSTLLCSLESCAAADYYQYNRKLGSYLGSDAIIITPDVEIIRDEDGKLLPESTLVSVMTCAAPNLNYGLEGKSEAEYQELVYRRICGMLRVAAGLGYRYLVLGAFGCGAFGNDAAVVSDLFKSAITDFRMEGKSAVDLFARIDFAVLSRSAAAYNFSNFYRNFGGNNFYGEDMVSNEIRRYVQDRGRIRGCMLGGAIGDALGYAVEFLRLESIKKAYGEGGIREYQLDTRTNLALISDDTQMALFTANGLLVGEMHLKAHKNTASLHTYVESAYLDWLKTQTEAFEPTADEPRDRISWLLDIAALYSRRAPGNTCLSALLDIKSGKIQKGGNGIEKPRNQSKGCGGVMRIAPLALKYNKDIESLDMEGAKIAAITHGHPLGYIPAAMLTHIINRIIYPENQRESLRDIIIEARDMMAKLFPEEDYLNELNLLIDMALELSENAMADTENIKRLGAGWCAPDALAIALYCALRYQNDFSKGIIAAVNHDGDSDSTGAITGNILGALLGEKAIDEKWLADLELKDVILEISDDLFRGCPLEHTQSDVHWESKYLSFKWRKRAHNAVYFYEADKEYGVLSNWYKKTFIVDGVSYCHVEQYFMAQKAKLFGDNTSYRRIMAEESPKICKSLGRNVAPFDAGVWDNACFSVVKKGVYAKFSQNPALCRELLSTGNAWLAEASPRDPIWGLGIDADTADSISPEQLPGRNLLGKILMEVREKLLSVTR